ncbi:MAG TPA: ABC transporter permease [Bacteroidales bacterium]|nr:ABC transporter permease [Bacteroidales bacterium]
MIIPGIKSAIRNVTRNKVTSVISLLGLGIGLGCILVLMALIVHEKSFDRFIPGYRNVYRIIHGTSANTQYPLAESMANDFPEVKDYFRFYQANSLQMKSSDQGIARVNSFCFSDPSIFRILGIKFINGSPATTISEVAVSDETAIKYFRTVNAAGKVLLIKFTNEFIPLSVSGVYKKFPSNSTLNPEFVAEIKLSEKMFRQFQRSLGDFGSETNYSFGWRNKEFISYVQLSDNADPSVLARKMDKFRSLAANEKKDEVSFSLQPVSDIYLGSGNLAGGFFVRKGNPEELLYYEIISLLIFIISIANYILLSRASVAGRMREFGTRKVFGASGGKITNLVFLESLFIVLLSLIPASFIIEFGTDFINRTLGKTLTTDIFSNPVLIAIMVIVILLTVAFSGWFIGLRYSRVPAINLLHAKTRLKYNSFRWNYSFLVFHFTIFVILVSGVFAISKQIKYSLTAYTGINPVNVLVADLNSDELKKSFTSICNEIKEIPGVENTAGGSFIPPFGNYLPINLASPDGRKVRFDGLIMGEGLPELLGMEISEGSFFGPYKQGVMEVLINESSAKLHKLKAGDNFPGFIIRGVVKDFHAHSLHTLIQPMVILQQNPERMGLIAIKTDSRNDAVIIEKLRELFSKISPDEIFEVRYLTDDMNNFYSRERNQAKIIGAFSVLAATLSVMGLFGISLIAISRRTKEIGIRKVNGSMVSEILIMLNTDFIRWVIVSIVVAIPVSVYLLSVWLKRFAYKTEMSWWLFALAATSAITVAAMTVSWQSWKAATGNPVDALKYE